MSLSARWPTLGAARLTSYRVFEHRIDQVADDRVRRAGDADSPAFLDQGEDLLGAGVRLAGPWRSLDRQVRVPERQSEPDGRVLGRLVGAAERQRHRGNAGRRTAQQQRSRGVEPAPDHPRARVSRDRASAPPAAWCWAARPGPAPTAAARRSLAPTFSTISPRASSTESTTKPRPVIGSSACDSGPNLCSCGGNENCRSTDRFTDPTTAPPDSKPSASGSATRSDDDSVRT